MDPYFSPCVAVPARDEQVRLPTLVEALAGQSWQVRSGRPLPVVVVLNNCRDASRDVLAEAARRHSSLSLTIVEAEFPPTEAHVGSARRLALETALSGVTGLRAAVLLTTDADAIPAPDWVAANLAAIAAGADLVAGELFGDPVEERRLGAAFQRRAALHKQYAQAADHLAALIDPIPWDPEPRHHDHTGASLAVRADAYRAVGGLRPLPCREDLDLVFRLQAAGFRLRHAPEAQVTVSARLHGRAAGGMADCIRAWMHEAAAGNPLLVECPARIEARLHRRRSLRALGLHALIARFAPDEPDAPQIMPVERALALIARRIAAREEAAHAA